MATRAIRTVDVDASLLEDARSAMKPSAEAADAESGLSEEDALRIANEELHAMRRERRSAA
jgi:hypothetical protein